ncbi:hypothetical protein [Virgibacillus dokdonensis]|uniref:hypothetical protein n=1 Tax=Virgibacillus dokdonensis TaxID=302167 RepID=UPI0015F27016|nr:hypothetical protein [Virgibacillus dokdonensis]
MSVKPLKKGDKVVMHTCMEAEAHDGKIWTCRSNEFKHHPSHNYTSVMLEGYSGSFKTEFLQKVNVSKELLTAIRALNIKQDNPGQGWF